MPLVSEGQLMATSWSRNRKAIVMITNEWPRVRSAITPSSAANTPATTPPSGTHHQTETSGTRVARIASV